MENNTYMLWSQDEFSYPVVGDFIPNITAYVHSDNKIRPAFLVVPGGGYRMVSASEGEIVAKKFYEKGFQSFVLTYTTCMPGPKPLKFQAMKDLSKAIVFLRKEKERFKIQEQEITICGFSAGAHLCGCLAVHFDEKEIQIGGLYEGISNRPDFVVLSYPVITSGPYAHQDSFLALLGENATPEELDYMSLEKHVRKDTSPIFLWQTATDETVPVENSYLFAEACKEAGISYEHHVFRKGMHGLSLANEEWASGNYGGHYAMRQLEDYIIACIEAGETPVPPFSGLEMLPKGTDVIDAFIQGTKTYVNYQPEPSVAIWPDLVDNWLKDLIRQHK